jgi:tryptophan-rich sensory protein
MNSTSPTNPKPTWVRLAMAIGITCAVICLLGCISSFVVWHINASKARFYDHVIGLAELVSLLITFICGLILLKHGKLGIILVTVAVVIFWVEALFPEL